MNYRNIPTGLFLSIFPIWVCALTAWAQSEDPSEFFENRVRPVLATQCYSCHAGSQLGGLRADSREGLLKGGKSGPAIVPGKPDESLLIRAITQVDPNLKMPLGGKLKEQEIGDLTTWVKAGAFWPEAPKGTAGPTVSKNKGETITAEQRAFWSFQPIRKVALPAVKNTGWIKTPLDRFILARLEAQNLQPAGPADKRTLLRRATLDLTGLPPTPEEMEGFLGDSSPEAFAKVVDRLLSSPHYGERWGRYWLDVARYGEDDPRGLSQEKYPNAFRYRDWVIEAFNRDLPYDLFVKAQIAGDLLASPKEPEKLVAATGFFGLGPWYYDTTVPAQARADERHDRVDVLTRGFLGLTVACARCHDHKFDPISTKDYYSLAGVFSSSQYREYPLAPEALVKAYHDHQKRIQDQEATIKQFVETQNLQLGEILSRKSSRYVVASWKILTERQRNQSGPRNPASPEVNQTAVARADTPGNVLPGAAGSDAAPSPTVQTDEPDSILKTVAQQEQLDPEILQRWVRYLGTLQKDHPYLTAWNKLLQSNGSLEEVKRVADEFQSTVLSIIEEKKAIDERNRLVLEKSKPSNKGSMTLLPNGFSSYEEFCPGCNISIEALDRDKFVLWSDLFSSQVDGNDPTKRASGVLLFQNEKLERFLGEEWRSYWHSMKDELDLLKRTLPPQYPYLHALADSDHPANLKVHLRGSPFNLGEEVPRKFLAVLSSGETPAFRQGSGRLELAEAIVRHPLTARVIANRIWMLHFGQGVVGTPSNFGRLGEPPTHPELLEYLASRLIEKHWSIKALHREILLSAVYQLSSQNLEKNMVEDPDNRLLWRANRRRLDAEALRDSLLFVAGNLDPTLGGASFDLNTENHRRTVYGKVSRFKLDGSLVLFDFPNPGITSEKRNVTHVPLQKLFFLNSQFISAQAMALASRLESLAGNDSSARIRKAYQILYGRDATETEIHLGLEFVNENSGKAANEPRWPLYTQVLLSANEFLFVE